MSLDLSLLLYQPMRQLLAVHSAQIVDAMLIIGILFDPHSSKVSYVSKTYFLMPFWHIIVCESDLC